MYRVVMGILQTATSGRENWSDATFATCDEAAAFAADLALMALATPSEPDALWVEVRMEHPNGDAWLIRTAPPLAPYNGLGGLFSAQYRDGAIWNAR